MPPGATRIWNRDAETVILPRVIEPMPTPADLSRLEMVRTALDLVTELWPKPGYASVVLESHQWAKLRRLLLSLPELVAHDE